MEIEGSYAILNTQEQLETGLGSPFEITEKIDDLLGAALSDKRKLEERLSSDGDELLHWERAKLPVELQRATRRVTLLNQMVTRRALDEFIDKTTQ